MGEPASNLGICFFSDRLFYSINEPEDERKVRRIGCFDFNFDVVDAIREQSGDQFSHIVQSIHSLMKKEKVGSIRVLTNPAQECWTALPKVVYDNADEREDHLNIIMKGVNREDLEPIWHAVNKRQYKFLCIRRRSVMNGYDALHSKVGSNEYLSDFELAPLWSNFQKPGGSFLMIGCHKHILSVTSFLLGKLRAATFIRFDEWEDLPYHWLQHAAKSPWMNGVHEHTYLYGHQTHEARQILQQYWDSSSDIITLNSLDRIGVIADEETYGFDLAAAFPAILLSLHS